MAWQNKVFNRSQIELLMIKPSECNNDEIKSRKKERSSNKWNICSLILWIYSSPICFVSNLIYKIIFYLKSLDLIPEFVWNLCLKWAKCQEITIYDILSSIIMTIIIVWCYEISRPGSKLLYGDNEKAGDLRAIWIYKIEKICGIYWEESIQSLFIHNIKWQKFYHFIYYKIHGIFTGIVYYSSLFVFASRKTKIWYLYFWIFNSSLIVSTIIYTVFPLSPPRLASISGVIDSFHIDLNEHICDSVTNHNGWANCYAAMPSVHVIASICTSFMACYHLKIAIYHIQLNNKCFNIIFKFIISSFFIIFTIYCPLMHLTIIVSGHHWILDIIGAYIILAINYYIVYKLLYLESTLLNTNIHHNHHIKLST